MFIGAVIGAFRVCGRDNDYAFIGAAVTIVNS